MNLPPVTKNLIIINALLFFATFALQRVGIDLTNLLGLHFFLAPQFKLHQLFTYMFMHGGFEHILFNMFAVWMFGRMLEQVWGSKRFLIFYIVCGVGAGLCQEVAQYASYLIDGLNR
jgi:membrane associated rhomboid family serine protease